VVIPRIDQSLAYFVEKVNQDESADAGVHLTLTCSGVVLSGHLIGTRAYFDGLRELAEQRAVGGSPEILAPLQVWGRQAHQAMRDRLRRRDEAVRRLPEGERLSNEQLDEYSPNYIHLQQVTVRDGTGQFQLPLWRGRLSEVTGWTLSPTD
jgi:hypothetical protein